MQIAVISDLHGNWPALEAVMNEIRKLGVEKIICLGDMVDPLPASRRVFEFLMDQKTPMIRGNHEDYIVASFENPDHPINSQLRFKPVQLVASTFSSREVEALKRLPLQFSIDENSPSGLLLCHASPHSNTRGWHFHKSEDMDRELETVVPQTIVCGHWHDPKTINWKDKTLVTAGSVGLPLAEQFEAQFLLLERTPNGWRNQHLTVPYDAEQAISDYIQSGLFHQGGPMAWLLMCELATATRQVGPFFEWMKSNDPNPITDSEWSQNIQRYLEGTGKWPVIESMLAGV
jgi:predicted phosphodiesterase